MNETQIDEIAKTILEKQPGTKQWGTTEHCALLAIICSSIANDPEVADDKAARKLMAGTLAINGIGGNSSQYRQHLIKAKILTGKTAALENDYL